MSQKDHFATSFDSNPFLGGSHVIVECFNEFDRDDELIRIKDSSKEHDIVIYDGNELNSDIEILQHLSEYVSVLLVLSDDPQCIVGTFKSLKKYSLTDINIYSMSMIVNNVENKMEADAVHGIVGRVCKKYINLDIGFAGFVINDQELLQSFRRRSTSTDAFSDASWFDRDSFLSFLAA